MNEMIAIAGGIVLYVLVMWVVIKAATLDKTPYEDEQVDRVADSVRGELEAFRKDGAL